VKQAVGTVAPAPPIDQPADVPAGSVKKGPIASGPNGQDCYGGVAGPNGCSDAGIPIDKNDPAEQKDANRVVVTPTKLTPTVQSQPAVVPDAGITPGADATGTTAGTVASKYSAMMAAGGRAGALALAKSALAANPTDKNLQALVDAGNRGQQAESTVKTRAKELLAGLRGDTGADAPPAGAGLTSNPALASAISFPGLGAGGGMSPAAIAGANAAALREAGARLSNPMVRDAVSKFAVGDLAGAQGLLDRRLADNPSDETALRFRALVHRRAGRYEPSAHDAKSALTLAPWDTRAHRALIDDMVDLGHPGQALEEANTALAEMPTDAQLFAARANAHAALGEHDAELADLKQAAALDAQFDALYREKAAGPARESHRPRSTAVWLGAVGTALLFFSFALFRKRGESSVRMAMRQDDHELLARGARPAAAPAGFQILKTLGQGGMGVVYEAMDLGLQRAVALKKLRAEIADSPRERSRFLKEARTVAALKHPNIVEIHAIHEDAEGLFLVFEKVQGETLHERLGRGPLAPAEAVGLLRQVGRALDYAHHAGVVHQDLKPANMMVAGDAVKVMDFGIARRVAETMSTLSRVEVAGTPAYMAPEQERGGAVGPAADVFALGACAYETLTGKTPFPSGGMMMKAEKMYRPATDVNPALPSGMNEVIARALDPEPAKRWPTAGSFVEALARSLAVPA
jgi:tRNA A-37 threonylcarbamoyl transferase component Bud32